MQAEIEAPKNLEEQGICLSSSENAPLEVRWCSHWFHVSMAGAERENKWDMIQLFAELNMLRKLFAAIWSERQVWLSPERFTHYLVYSSSGFAPCLVTKQISTLSVYQRNKASLALLSYYSICFPMTTNGAALE